MKTINRTATYISTRRHFAILPPMYSLNDDDFEGAGPSSTDVVTKGSLLAARKAALKRQLEKKGVDKNVASKVDPAKSALQRSVLMNQIEGQKDDQNKRDQLQKEKAAGKSGTKTRMQEEKQSVQGADMKPDAEKMVKQNDAEQKGQEELQQTDVSTEGG